MPNRLTRVPGRQPPALGGPVGRVVPLADLFMLLMLSRPATGSLRTTWVTPSSLWLCLALTAIGLPIDGLLLASGSVGRAIAGAVLLALAIGSAAVAAVGVQQRRG